jgi:GntR family transcriptional regulator/MocR family aminotransferase
MVSVSGNTRARQSIAPTHGLTLRSAYHIDLDRLDDNVLVLGYGGVKEVDIEGAVKRLRKLYDIVLVHQV